jgi:hypothetical protein
MISRQVFFLVLCACLLFSHRVGYAEATSPLSIEASGVYEKGEPIVSFRVTNMSHAPLVINASALPWGDRYSVLLVVIVRNTEEALHAHYPVSDVFFETPIRLDANESKLGEIALSSHFGDVSARLRKSDLFVFWIYEPKSADGVRLGQYGGWLMFPKTKAK